MHLLFWTLSEMKFTYFTEYLDCMCSLLITSSIRVRVYVMYYESETFR